MSVNPRWAVLAGFVAATAAHAMPLDLTQNPPDIFVSGLTISYTDATDTFLATGTPITYDPDGIPPQHNITGGSYTLQATIDALGVMTGATLTITGSTTDKAGNPVSPTLLTAAGTSGWGLLFGFSPDLNDPSQPWLPDPITDYPAKFEFMLSVTGGGLVGDYYGVGSLMGIIISVPSGGFDGDFSGDFTISGGGVVADNFAIIPEPASLAILALGAVALVRRRRHSRTTRPAA